jgi:hypothetical protein
MANPTLKGLRYMVPQLVEMSTEHRSARHRFMLAKVLSHLYIPNEQSETMDRHIAAFKVFAVEHLV